MVISITIGYATSFLVYITNYWYGGLIVAGLEVGNEFANGVASPASAGLINRRRYLPARVQGLEVLHLGCVDEHLLGTRSNAGTLLHAALVERAAHVTGVDLSEDGIAELKKLVPGTYLIGNVEDMNSLDLPAICDLVVAGEIIEHLKNPGNFLIGLADYLRKTDASALITTPNAYSWIGFVRFVMGKREPTHPDHVSMFSPVTLCKLMEDCELEVTALYAHRWDGRRGPIGRLLNAIDQLILSRRPWLSVGLVAEVRPKDTDANPRVV